MTVKGKPLLTPAERARQMSQTLGLEVDAECRRLAAERRLSEGHAMKEVWRDVLFRDGFEALKIVPPKERK